MKLALLIGSLGLLLSSPAAAEGFATLWTFEDVTSTLPTEVELQKPFFEQRILHHKLVKLDQDVTTATGKIVSKGTPLYLILGKKDRQAFCTFKDSSTGNVAKSLFIPALDRRPCFIDDDRDGRFEKSFSVFEAWGTVVPEARGNMTKATAIPPVAYSAADRSASPTDYRVTLHVFKRGKIARPELRFLFAGKNDSVMQTIPSVAEGDVKLSSAFNHELRMKLTDTSRATVSMTKTGQNFMYVINDNYIMLKPDELSKMLGSGN
jgi:hypothetical protein